MPDFWKDPISSLLSPLTPTPEYVPQSTQLANTSYDLFQQAQALQNPAASSLISYATSPAQATQAAQQASALAGQQAGAMQSFRDRINALAGVTSTPAQQAQQSLQDSLGTAQATAGAANQARAGTAAIQSAVLAK